MKNTNYLTEDIKWVSFYPNFNSSFFVEKAGYFDERPEVHTSVTQLLALVLLPFMPYLFPFVLFGWGKLYIHLPIRTGIQDCDSAAWGFNYHNNKIWIYIGGGGNFEGGKKWKTFTMPWDLIWVRTSTLMKDNTWFHETDKNRIKWIKDDGGLIVGSKTWLDKNKWSNIYPYIDYYDDSVVNATVHIVEREWRPLGLKWTKVFVKKCKCIEVNFEKEVGKEKGSWKGGVLGTGYNMLPYETPYECLMRMQEERKF